MDYFESWKELILHPGKGVLKRKKGFDTAKIALYLVSIALIGSFVVAYGNGAQMEAMFGIGAGTMFAAWFAYMIANELATFFCIHWLAGALGGKGSLRGLLSAHLEAFLPFSILSLVFFVPYAGFALGAMAGLASITAWIVVFKYLRLVYGLPVERALAALFVPIVLLGMAAGVVFMAAAFSSFVAGAAANAPVITQTASGSHFYSPMYGGYSFDFPFGWEYVDLANETGTPILGSFLRNSFIGVDILRSARANGSAIVYFELSKNGDTALDDGTCNNGTIRESGMKGIDASAASADYVTVGKLKGCMMRNLRSVENGGSTAVFIANNCAAGYDTAVTTMEEDAAVLMRIAKSFRCGSEAVK